MTQIRFMADMNISPQTVSALQQQGWDIIRVPDVLPANTSDEEILNFCRQENRTIISFDLDFSMLVASKRSTSGTEFYRLIFFLENKSDRLLNF